MSVPLVASLEPLVLPQIHRDEARALNTFIGRRRMMRFAINKTEWGVRLMRVARSFDPHHHWRISYAGKQVAIRFANPTPGQWKAEELHDLDTNEMPPELQQIVLEEALRPLRKVFEVKLGSQFQLEIMPNEEKPNEDWLCLGWESGQVGRAVSLFGDLWLPREELLTLAKAFEGIPASGVREWLSLRFPVNIEIGATELSSQDLKELRVQDIALLDEGFSVEERNCFVVVENAFRFPATVEGPQVTATGRLQPAPSIRMPEAPQENKPPQDAPAKQEPPKAESASLEDLPVRLSFSLGETELSLAELRSIQEGFTFELNRPANQPVLIRAHGKVIATGELLQIGDRVGVRLTEFLAE